jgi:hypothetical protein
MARNEFLHKISIEGLQAFINEEHLVTYASEAIAGYGYKKLLISANFITIDVKGKRVWQGGIKDGSEAVEFYNGIY